MSENSKTLLIDAGNSSLKWTLCDGYSLSKQGSQVYDAGREDFGIGNIFGRLNQRIEQVVIASVAREAIEQALVDKITKDFSLKPIFQQVQAEHQGFTIAYADATQLGVDRWLAMIGARSIHDGAFCVADCGTALTLDCVDAEGVHLGGVIVPGSRLMQEALLSRAAKINQAEKPLPKTIFANHTAGAVNAGCHYAQAAVLDRFVLESKVQLKQSPLVVVTGGGRSSLIQICHCDVIEVPDLVLIGLGLACGVLKSNHPTGHAQP